MPFRYLILLALAVGVLIDLGVAHTEEEGGGGSLLLRGESAPRSVYDETGVPLSAFKPKRFPALSAKHIDQIRRATGVCRCPEGPFSDRTYEGNCAIIGSDGLVVGSARLFYDEAGRPRDIQSPCQFENLPQAHIPPSLISSEEKRRRVGTTQPYTNGSGGRAVVQLERAAPGVHGIAIATSNPDVYPGQDVLVVSTFERIDFERNIYVPAKAKDPLVRECRILKVLSTSDTADRTIFTDCEGKGRIPGSINFAISNSGELVPVAMDLDFHLSSNELAKQKGDYYTDLTRSLVLGGRFLEEIRVLAGKGVKLLRGDKTQMRSVSQDLPEISVEKKSAIERLQKESLFDHRPATRPLSKFQSNSFQLDRSFTQKLMASTGQCLCHKRQGFGSGSCAIVGSKNQVVSAAHVFLDVDGKPGDKCIFRSHANPKRQVPLLLDPANAVFGAYQITTSPAHDWAVVRLAEAIPGAEAFVPDMSAMELWTSDRVLNVTELHGFWPEPVVQECGVYRNPDHYLELDCFSRPGMSGSLAFSKNQEGALSPVGVVKGGTMEVLEDAGYKRRFSRFIPMKGDFRDAIFALAEVSSAIGKINLTHSVLTPLKETQLKDGEEFKECDECPRMVVIPTGRFLMGGAKYNERPEHEVVMSKTFAVGKFVVTLAEWDACVKAGECTPKSDNAPPGRNFLSADYLSWDDAKAYVNWLSKHTKQPYRLLSEAEWEYVARAGSTSKYWWGDELTSSGRQIAARAADNSVWMRIGRGFPPNQFGIADLYGNVQQWVEDCDNGNYSDAPSDGSAWANIVCTRRILRGGVNLDQVNAASRSGQPSGWMGHRVGLRVARALAQPSLGAFQELDSKEPHKRSHAETAGFECADVFAKAAATNHSAATVPGKTITLDELLASEASKVSVNQLRDEKLLIESGMFHIHTAKDGSVEEVRSSWDTVKEYYEKDGASARLYLKGNRIAGFSFRKGSHRTVYALKPDCALFFVGYGDGREDELNESVKLTAGVTPAFCARQDKWGGYLVELPTQVDEDGNRPYGEACKKVGGSYLDRCTCISAVKITDIDARVEDCGSPLPERLLREEMTLSSAVLETLSKQEGKKLADLCELSASSFENRAR
ncbi:MAG: hypothetical protein EKK29_18965 [Hyphomicrobiales bacterium]|nr:MAG: hypothetical protein EKK29_18965 [Hyphomicrobiales bacterium]